MYAGLVINTNTLSLRAHATTLSSWLRQDPYRPDQPYSLWTFYIIFVQNSREGLQIAVQEFGDFLRYYRVALLRTEFFTNRSVRICESQAIHSAQRNLGRAGISWHA